MTIDVPAARRRVPLPENDPNLSYRPGSPERAELKARLAAMAGEVIDIPIIIGGREIRTGDTGTVVMPHDHAHVLATWHKATPALAAEAAASALEARREWASWSFDDRAAVFLRAAELLTTTWRPTLNAATMLGQSKTAYQAEIDAASELVDFWRFNVAFAQELLDEQPISSHGVWNQSEYRGLEGFVYAVTPFNFTAIGGNLAGAPALMGCTVVWKPAATALLGNYYTYKLLEAAGLPPGVINFVPGDPVAISEVLLDHRDLGGIHFTGSTAVFNSMWTRVGQNMGHYRSYPRIVGETGGKDFIVAHASADPQALAVAAVRGAFEFQGQKCSAASRLYVPRSMWPDVRDRMVAMMRDIRMGDVRDFRNFMGAVIDQKAFHRIRSYVDDARQHARIIEGGGCDDAKGYFVQPTLVETDDPGYRLLCEEIFGPVLTVHAYDDARWHETLAIVDRTSPYALTGSVFARDRQAIREASTVLRNSAGNFYINTSPRARWWGSSRSAGRGRVAPTTRPARR